MSPKKLFVIRPIGDPESDVRKDSDRIREKYIEPAARRAGYVPYGDEAGPGLAITAEIIRALEGDPMVIAYLGHPPWNANVMFEVGYRLATNKPLVILRHTGRGENLPFDLYDYHCIPVPPYVQSETPDESSNTKIVEVIEKAIHHRRGLTRLKSGYAVAEILIDQRELPNDERESIVTASSEPADRIFHMKDSLIGKNILDVMHSLRPRVDGRQWGLFEKEQAELIGRLGMGQGQNPKEIRAKVPFIFKDSTVDDVDSPEYIDPELRERAFLAIIVQHRQLRSTLSLRMLYFDVTGALKPEGDYFVCDLPKVAPRIGETILKIQGIPIPRFPYPDSEDPCRGAARTRKVLGLKLDTGDVGVRVADVVEGSPAARAGLRQGDVLVRIQDRDVDDLCDAHAVVAAVRLGEEVVIELRRRYEMLTSIVKT